MDPSRKLYKDFRSALEAMRKAGKKYEYEILRNLRMERGEGLIKQVDGPLDTSSEDDGENPAKRPRIESDEEVEYFPEIKKIEEDIFKENQGLENYLGNLKAEGAWHVLPFGYLALREADDFNDLKKETEENVIIIKMLRKIVKGKKEIIPVCRKCNSNETTEAIIKQTKFIIKDNIIEDNLKECKHAKVSKALYERTNVLKVENQKKNCTVLTNTSKLHVAACYDGKSYAIVVCRKGRHSNKGKCLSCKGDKCGHQQIWNQELRELLLKGEKTNEKEETEVEDSNSEGEEEEVTAKNERPRLKFPPTKATQETLKKFEAIDYNTQESFVDDYNNEKCELHDNDYSEEDPVGKG